VNLSWTNPDNYAQQDVLFARGTRVYRVGEVLAGVGAQQPPARRLHGSFLIVDTLACRLQGARCLPAAGLRV
jgi:hypothetical protein